jgi:hypothetical protein
LARGAGPQCPSRRLLGHAAPVGGVGPRRVGGLRSDRRCIDRVAFAGCPTLAAPHGETARRPGPSRDGGGPVSRGTATLHPPRHAIRPARARRRPPWFAPAIPPAVGLVDGPILPTGRCPRGRFTWNQRSYCIGQASSPDRPDTRTATRPIATAPPIGTFTPPRYADPTGPRCRGGFTGRCARSRQRRRPCPPAMRARPSGRHLRRTGRRSRST